MVRDYERGTTTAVVAGCGVAAVVGCGATAITGCEIRVPLGVVLGVIAAAFDGGVRYAGVPLLISAPSSSSTGCPAPRYGGVFPPRIEPLPIKTLHLLRCFVPKGL
jgi:hypothetical protein